MTTVPSAGTDAPQLLVVNGPSGGTRIRVAGTGTTLGRRAGDVAFDSDTQMSRRHATVSLGRDSAVVVTDLGSANGTFINDRAITGPAHLNTGDVLRLGVTEFTLEPPPQSQPQDHVDAGKRLLAAGDIAGAIEAFTAALSHGTDVSDAHYGLGLSYLAKNDRTRAAQCLERARQSDPGTGNPAFQLGLIAESQHQTTEALTWYQEALRINPDHRSARERIQAIGPPARPGADRGTQIAASGPHTTLKAQPVVPDKWAVPSPVRSGISIIDFLQQDGSTISLQALELIESLELRTRPRFAAYAGRFGGMVLAGTMGLFLLVGIAATTADTDAAGVLVVLMLIVLADLVFFIGMYAVTATSMIALSQGRLQIESGILRKELRNIDLWRVLNVNLDRTLLNRMSGDGSLVLILTPDPTAEPLGSKQPTNAVYVTGMARQPELAAVYQDILSLVFLLRGNPVVKGIIQ